MRNLSPPIISFELGVGEFRIVTAEVVYQIRVRQDLIEASDALARQIPAVAPASAPAAGGNFFQEISEELFAQVGQLARKLSVSVEDLPGPMNNTDLSKTGEELENAKGQLEEVVAITEKASMTIMDLADQIQGDMDQLKSQMDTLNALEVAVISDEAAVEAAAEAAEAPEGGGRFAAALARLTEFLAGLTAAPAASAPAAPAEAAPPPSAEPPAEPPAEAARGVAFDLDVVFQTLYEFCTNESVKEHIKHMRESKEATFDIPGVARSLSELAAAVNEEDGFYDFPIPAVLKILYGASNSEEHKATLKKMNQTAASIFQDAILPLEGQAEEAAAPAEEAPAEEAAVSAAAPAAEVPAETPPAGESPEVPARVLATLRSLADELSQATFPATGGGQAGGAYTSILTSDRDTMVKTINQSNLLIKNTSTHLTRIMEALSFQDLSGQRIKKIVALLSEVQVQLLSLLVSVNTKLKAHQDEAATAKPAEETRKMAQDEVDRMLEKVSGGSTMLGPGADHRLDQGAVNDLLAQLGF